MYSYIRGQQLEGTFPLDPSAGVWLTSAMRIYKGWGMPPESEFPYNGNLEDFPPDEPEGIDALAKQFRLSTYRRIRSQTEGKIILASELSFTASFNITDQWFDAENGVIKMPSADEEPTAGHSIHIIGYNDNASQFIFQNSWGTNWGDKGYGYMPYEFFEKNLSEAWYCPFPLWQPPTSTDECLFEIIWGLPDLLDNVLHGREIYDKTNDECVGWVFAVCRDGFLDIEELFVKPDYRSKGKGLRLAQMIKELSGELNLPLRIWVSHIDDEDNNIIRINKIAKYLDLSLQPSAERWAAYQIL